MNCSDCQKNLPAYLEEALPETLRDHMKDHLDHCSKCSPIYHELREAYQRIDAEKAITCNPFLATRVMAEIENREIPLHKEPAFKRIMQTALMAVSISIAVLGGFEAGNLYSIERGNRAVPDEMVFMNDAALESLSIYASE